MSHPSLGAALLAYLEEHAGGSTPGRKTSYTAVGWHAQIRQLTGHSRGSAAADAVGLDPTARTLRRWLAGNEPTKANQERIAAAYRRLANDFPAGVKGKTQQITGLVDIGGDLRDRGGADGVALKIGAGNGGDWTRIEDAWNDGTLTADLLEDLYYEDVVVPDLDSTDDIAFPGSSYSVA